ncbi:hypothetical protein ACIBEJ_51275 [Nonomuraea sp. NPDC050790]|uniref:hypothetical protein n=1 Tax=Nonomuraea sp. NPDC050790 TaxID=3364371 RepID=UPI00378C86ED
MMLRLLVVTALAAAMLVSTTTAACACTCAELTPAEAVKHAAAVFTGTVVSVKTVKGPPNAQKVYTFRTDHAYKGTAATEYQVGADTDSPACGYVFEQGTRYLVFAGSDGRIPGVNLSTTLCSGNIPIRAGKDPVQAGDERQATHETIAGRVTEAHVTALGTPRTPGEAVPAEATSVYWRWVATVAVLTTTALTIYARHNPSE